MRNILHNLKLTLILSTLAAATLGAQTQVPSRAAAGPGWFAIKGNTLTVSSGLGIAYGQAGEYVYSGSYKVSELVWPMRPIFYLHNSLELKTRSGFEAGVTIKSAFDGPSGNMEDWDFLNGDGKPTHFSLHNGLTERAIRVEATAGWNYPSIAGSSFDASIDLSIAYQSYRWTARDGYLQYPPQSTPPYTPWSESTAKTIVYGTGIGYQQRYLIPGMRLRGAFRPTAALEFGISIGVSPYARCWDIDDHFFTGVEYKEDMKNGLSLSPKLEALFALGPKLRLGLDIGYQGVFGLIGDTVATQTGTGGGSTVYKNGAGASLSLAEASIALSLRL